MHCAVLCSYYYVMVAFHQFVLSCSPLPSFVASIASFSFTILAYLASALLLLFLPSGRFSTGIPIHWLDNGLSCLAPPWTVYDLRLGRELFNNCPISVQILLPDKVGSCCLYFLLCTSTPSSVPVIISWYNIISYFSSVHSWITRLVDVWCFWVANLFSFITGNSI